LVQLVGTDVRLAERWSYAANPFARFFHRGTVQLGMLLTAALAVILTVFWAIALDTLQAQSDLHAVDRFMVIGGGHHGAQIALSRAQAGSTIPNHHLQTVIATLSTAEEKAYPQIAQHWRGARAAQQRVRALFAAELAALRGGRRDRALSLMRAETQAYAVYRNHERALRTALLAPIRELEGEVDTIVTRTKLIAVVGVASLALIAYLIAVALIDGWTIESFAELDALTGLTNRHVFEARFAQALARHARDDTPFGIVYADIDAFKTINDGLGHAAGDTVLRGVARRFSGAVRRRDFVARIGGDEFALLLTDVENAEDCRTVAARVTNALHAKPLEIGDRRVSVKCSVGASFCPDDGLDFETLMTHADNRMFHAKRDPARVAGAAVPVST